MTISDWEKEVKTRETKDLETNQAALETVLQWPAFKREYGWTGLELVRIIIVNELRSREYEDAKKVYRGRS